MSDWLGAVAASWGVMMAISPLLQIRRMWERRSSADVSIAYLGVLQVGFTLWVAYGWSLGNLAIFVPNSVAFLVGVATVIIALRLRHPHGVPADQASPNSGARAPIGEAQEPTGQH